MALETIRDVFMWSSIINYSILLVWFLVFALAHDWMHTLHGKWFKLRREQFDAVHYSGMAGFKLLILIFNVTPYVSLVIVG
ncbi:MAG: hypothetical protein C4518_00990 [Desulfobacteraceae bacterium]|nr:MAG: hypothetical protein C4518_00990 [Desulfobacteraceae bacterium]